MKKKLWDIKNYWMEIKLGIFFIIAFFLLFFALLSIREVTFLKGVYILKAEFDFAEGLAAASPVRFNGVDVGEVKKVEIINKNGIPKVLVLVKISNDVRIPKGSFFIINSLSLFGEKYLEILSPTTEISEYLDKNSTVEGNSPKPLFYTFVTFHKTMEELSAFVREGKLKDSLEHTITNIEEISEELKGLVKDVKNSEGTVGRLLYDDALYQKTQEFIDDLKQHPWKLLHKPKERKK